MFERCLFLVEKKLDKPSLFANHGLNKNGEEDATFHIQATPSIYLENTFSIEAIACDLILQATLKKMLHGFLPGTDGGLIVL